MGGEQTGEPTATTKTPPYECESSQQCVALAYSAQTRQCYLSTRKAVGYYTTQSGQTGYDYWVNVDRRGE